jgi:hypothetical protein
MAPPTRNNFAKPYDDSFWSDQWDAIEFVLKNMQKDSWNNKMDTLVSKPSKPREEHKSKKEVIEKKSDKSKNEKTSEKPKAKKDTKIASSSTVTPSKKQKRGEDISSRPKKKRKKE